MPQLSEKVEGAIIGVASACAAISASAAIQPIPEVVKIPLVSVTAIISGALYAFWYGYVNKKPTQPTQ